MADDFSPDAVPGEGRALLDRLGFVGAQRTRAIGIHILLIGLFGIVLPWSKDLDFFDPAITGAYASLGVIFAAPAVAAPFASRALGRVYARILTCCVYGELMSVGMLAGGVTTVLITHKGRVLFYPDWSSLALYLVFGIVLMLAVSMIAAWATLRFSPGVAKGTLRVLFLILLAFYFLRGARFLHLPEYGTITAGIVTVVAAIALRTVAAPGAKHA